jgi:hypothetical protein
MLHAAAGDGQAQRQVILFPFEKPQWGEGFSKGKRMTLKNSGRNNQRFEGAGAYHFRMMLTRLNRIETFLKPRLTRT